MAYRNKKTGEVMSDAAYQQRISGGSALASSTMPTIDKNIGIDFGTQKTTTPTRSFGEDTLDLSKGLLRETTKPIVQSLVRPVQLAESIRTGETPTYNLPFYGEIKPPQSYGEAIGTGLKTVGLGLGPVAGGALFGGGQALEEGRGALGVGAYTAGGALGGKILGSIGTKVLEKIPITKTAKEKYFNNAIKSIAPETEKLPQSLYKKALGEFKISPQTKLKGQQYVVSEKEQSIAKRFADLLQSKNPVKNFQNVANRVQELDESIGAYLQDNLKSFKPAQLKVFLQGKLKGIGEGVGTSAKSIQKAKNDMIDNFIKDIQSPDNWNLWKQRKNFDYNADKYTRAFSGVPTLKKDITKTFRNSVQDFINEATPDDVYQSTMKDMRDLIGLIEDKGVLTLKSLSDRKYKGDLMQWMNQNKGKLKAIGIGALGLGGILAGQSIFDRLRPKTPSIEY